MSEGLSEDWQANGMKASTITMATDHLRRAAVRATWAHSIYNTQPWQLRLDGDGLHVYADRSRQLNVVDPTGRLLLMSIGCALLNAQASLAAHGVPSTVARFPSGAEPDLVATLGVGTGPLDPSLVPLAARLESRFCDQRLFYDDAVPDDTVRTLRDAAAAERATLLPVAVGDQRRALTALSVHADAIENLNAAYRAEIRAWTHGGRERADTLTGLPDEGAAQSFLALLCTDADAPQDWLDAGQALARLLLVAANAGFATRVLVQVTEVRSVRSQLRRDLGVSGFPHVLLRLGRAPDAPMPGRRRLVDVLTEIG